MQLLLILALLLMGGDAESLVKQAQPFLKNLGGDDFDKTLKEIGEISQIVSALQPKGGAAGKAPFSVKNNGGTADNSGCAPAQEFPLAPIAAIADRDITYCMTKYFAEEG